MGICSDVVSEDTDWIISISQDLILPLMIRTKSHYREFWGRRQGGKGREVVRMAATGNFALWLTASILGVLLGDYIWSLWERRKRK